MISENTKHQAAAGSSYTTQEDTYPLFHNSSSTLRWPEEKELSLGHNPWNSSPEPPSKILNLSDSFCWLKVQ